MHSPSPLLCPPEEKAQREAANTVAQLDYLTVLVKDHGARELRESHILELQRIAVDGLYPCGGRYRDARFTLKISDSDHEPPPPALVPVRVQEMVEACNRKDIPANRRMAYALWYFNWLHPFAGGNGRTARAIAYLILCMDMKMMVPGDRSMPSLIAADRDGYLKALRAVDRAYKSIETGVHILDRPALIRPMIEYLDDKLVLQLVSGMPSGWRFLGAALRMLMRLGYPR